MPHHNDSDEVRLEVSEEISDVAGQQPLGTLGAIPFAKRTATTQLVVKDQQTVVIGGLVRSHVARTDTKIPLLGDIPVLGALFRSRSSSMTKSNLILVMTPYIIRDRQDLRTVFERKMQERQDYLDHYFVFAEQQEYEPPRDYSRTNGLLELIRQSYLDIDEQRRLDELTRPREMKTHEPGQPLELPAPIRAKRPRRRRRRAGPAPQRQRLQEQTNTPPLNVMPPASRLREDREVSAWGPSSDSSGSCSRGGVLARRTSSSPSTPCSASAGPTCSTSS